MPIGLAPGASMPYRAKPSAKEQARRHTKRAIARLAHLVDGAESEAVQRAAAVDLLDRAWGRPTQEITGADGAPLLVITGVARAEDKS